MKRLCPQCDFPLGKVWRYGDIEMGGCENCGEIPLATVCDYAPAVIAIETEFVATAVNDNTKDFFLRLSRLVPEYNVIQLKKMQVLVDDRHVVPLGIRTNTIDLPAFKGRVRDLNLTIELQSAER